MKYLFWLCAFLFFISCSSDDNEFTQSTVSDAVEMNPTLKEMLLLNESLYISHGRDTRGWWDHLCKVIDI